MQTGVVLSTSMAHTNLQIGQEQVKTDTSKEHLTLDKTFLLLRN